jgi:hypothetical protein
VPTALDVEIFENPPLVLGFRCRNADAVPLMSPFFETELTASLKLNLEGVFGVFSSPKFINVGEAKGVSDYC